MKIKESQLRNIIKECLLKEFRSGDNDGDIAYINSRGKMGKSDSGVNDDSSTLSKRRRVNGVYPNRDNCAGVCEKGKGQICWDAMQAMLNVLYGGVKGNHVQWTKEERDYINKICGQIYNFAKFTKEEGNRKRGYIKESRYSGTIYGTATYNPYEALADAGIKFDENSAFQLGANMQSLGDILYHSYDVSFKANGYDDSGNYDNPPERSLSHVSLYDDGGVSTLIQQMKDVEPELGQALENNFNEWCEQALYDAQNGNGDIVEWDWNSLGDDDYPEYDPDEF